MALAQEMVASGLAPETAHAVTGAVKAGLVATGSTQADALSLPAALNSFVTVAAGTGAILPLKSNAGDSITIYNGGANDLAVYPPSGGFLDGQAVNTPTTHVAASTGMYFCFAKNTWTSVQKGVTGSITGTGSAGDLAVWSGASNIVANSALAPATSVFVGATPFEFTESSPGVLQLGDANLTWTAASQKLEFVKILGGDPTLGIAIQADSTIGLSFLTLVDGANNAARSFALQAGANGGVTVNTSGDAALNSNVGTIVIGPSFASPNNVAVLTGQIPWIPDSDNASDLGAVTATIGFNTRWRTGYFGTSVAITPVAVGSLPGTPIAGEKAMVNNALAPAFGAPVAGAGLVTVPVFFDGAAWIVG